MRVNFRSITFFVLVVSCIFMASANAEDNMNSENREKIAEASLGNPKLSAKLTEKEEQKILGDSTPETDQPTGEKTDANLSALKENKNAIKATESKSDIKQNLKLAEEQNKAGVTQDGDKKDNLSESVNLTELSTEGSTESSSKRPTASTERSTELSTERRTESSTAGSTEPSAKISMESSSEITVEPSTEELSTTDSAAESTETPPRKDKSFLEKLWKKIDNIFG